MQQSVFDLILWQPFSMLCTNMTYFNSLISKSQIQKIKYHKSTHIRTLYHLKFWLESRQNSDLIKKKPTYFMKTSESSICLYIHAYLAKRDIVKHKKKIYINIKFSSIQKCGHAKISSCNLIYLHCLCYKSSFHHLFNRVFIEQTFTNQRVLFFIL